jgi:RecA-family ATPase
MRGMNQYDHQHQAPAIAGRRLMTTFTFDLMMHTALSRTYRGHRVVGGAVVYIALEGGDGMNARAEAFRRQHDLPSKSGADFHLVRDSMELVKDHGALLAVIKAALGDKPPVVVVIDTVNRSFSGSESSDEDMTDYIRAADAIWQAFQCAVVLLGFPKRPNSGPRWPAPRS